MPTVADGLVFVGTSDALNVYGLHAPTPPSPPAPPGGPTGAIGFATQPGGSFGLDLLVQPLASNGQPVGPLLVVPFPLDFFFHVVGVNRDASGNVVLTLNFFVVDLFLDYNSFGALIGFGIELV